jgi:hypothetical protein
MKKSNVLLSLLFFIFPLQIFAFSTTQPVGPTGSWDMVFEDNFDGTSLDTTKWDPNWYKEGASQNNVSTYASNVSVSGGNLILTLASSSSGASVNTQGNNGFQVKVGMYSEARVYFPGNGSSLYNWPAWWISGLNWPSAGEHDIAEVLGGSMTANYHSPSGGPRTYTSSKYMGDAFHIYGILRNTASADLYWDGVKVATYNTSDNGAGEQLIFNLGYSSSYPKYGTDGQVKVDYVRVWQPGSGVILSTPTVSSTPVPTPVVTRSPTPTVTTHSFSHICGCYTIGLSTSRINWERYCHYDHDS